MTRCRAGVAGVLALMTAATVGGCGARRASTAGTSAASGSVLPVVAHGDGWTAGGLDGPAYRSERCTYRSTRFRGVLQPLPDRRCTPGGIDPGVIQADLEETICRPGGYSDSVRPPESITEPAKYAALRAYRAAGPVHDYEFDHLVPLGLGGASDTQNLWPERDIGRAGPFIANTKDQVEADLHAAVCGGTVSLAAAQHAIATDWATAERTLRVAFGSGAAAK